MKKIEDDEKKTAEHEPSAVAYYFKCSYDDCLSYYKSHVGKDSAKWFMEELKAISEWIEPIFKNPRDMDELTADQT